ncbi:uncharacterized protein LOC128302652 [Anopheles moucheti]|uniref:uncharacterized protein LOC128302652 n=1 Tax=Anopheles moucheti TaxID=186751 RepID=UPI0022F00628|nr:uncharacterized protein LOC128302652 [Anopheles moucheti]
MKAVVLLLCFVALASAQIDRHLRQNSGYPISPRSLRGLPFNFANVGDLVATLIEQTVDYIFPDGSTPGDQSTVDGIGKLISWIVNQVIELLSGDEALRQMLIGNRQMLRLHPHMSRVSQTQ